MFGIGRLEEDVYNLESDLFRGRGPRPAVYTELRDLRNEIADLRSALSLFARRCDECGQWKRIDAKGWMKRGHSANSLMWFATDGTLQTSSGERHICPDCMAALKPVDEETKVNSDPSWKRWRR